MIKFISAEAPCNNNLPELSFNSEQCDDMVKMQDCIVNELEKCDQPTTANLVESLFQFIKRATPCGAKVSISLNIFHDAFQKKHDKTYCFIITAKFHETFHKIISFSFALKKESDIVIVPIINLNRNPLNIKI